MNCDKCEGGQFTIFTSKIPCPYCGGDGKTKSKLDISVDSLNHYESRYQDIDKKYATKTQIRNCEEVTQIIVPKKETSNTSQICVRSIANRSLDNDTEITLLSRNYEDRSYSTYIYYENIPRIHVGKCFDYHHIYKFYKNIKSVFPVNIFEIGGSYDSKEEDFHYNEEKNKKCPKCSGYGKFELAFTSEPCSLCDQTGLFGNTMTLENNFNKVLKTYDRTQLTAHTHRRSMGDSSFDIISEFMFYTRVVNIPVHRINAPPYEFETSEFCLRKLANQFLPYNTKISLFYFKKKNQINKYCSKMFLLKVITDEFLEATKFYEYLRNNLFYGELSLAIVPTDIDTE